MRARPSDLAGGFGPGAFQAYRAAALSLATQNFVIFDTEDIDSNGWYDADSGIFLPKQAGIYHFSWAVNAGGLGAANNFWTTSLAKNGIIHRQGQISFQTGASTPFCMSCGSADATADGFSDYFQILLQHNFGGTPTVAPASYATFFQGHLARPAAT